MTVEELIAKLRAMPSTACICFRTNEDDPGDYGDVDVFYDKGEVMIDIHGDDD